MEKNYISRNFKFSSPCTGFLHYQTISSTDGQFTRCSDCVLSGWSDARGTPDISDRNQVSAVGMYGGSANWNQNLEGRALNLSTRGAIPLIISTLNQIKT